MSGNVCGWGRRKWRMCGCEWTECMMKVVLTWHNAFFVFPVLSLCTAILAHLILCFYFSTLPCPLFSFSSLSPLLICYSSPSFHECMLFLFWYSSVVVFFCSIIIQFFLNGGTSLVFPGISNPCMLLSFSAAYLK